MSNTNPIDENAHQTKVSTAIVELQWRPQPQLAEFGPFEILTFPHNLRFYTL